MEFSSPDNREGCGDIMFPANVEFFRGTSVPFHMVRDFASILLYMVEDFRRQVGNLELNGNRRD